MRQSMFRIMLGCTASLVLASGAAHAQGGGNGQGGSGGGNAHSAATAGMTYRGDPAPSPLDVMPGSAMKPMSSGDTSMPAMSPDTAATPSTTGQ
ncbi:hypothetical protein AAGS40_18240 [Paraburkholderia sp. PREW-6R]|uniref:hypothetical protein n=1 Tax=Paraburkholderia sp. PREW-6R TaxID=3141544 RepID=UPI0031F4D68C